MEMSISCFSSKPEDSRTRRVETIAMESAAGLMGTKYEDLDPWI